jgi:hypothetical protein
MMKGITAKIKISLHPGWNRMVQGIPRNIVRVKAGKPAMVYLMVVTIFSVMPLPVVAVVMVVAVVVMIQCSRCCLLWWLSVFS